MVYLYEKRNKKKKALEMPKVQVPYTLDHLFTYLLHQLLIVSFLNAVIKREKWKKEEIKLQPKKKKCLCYFFQMIRPQRIRQAQYSALWYLTNRQNYIMSTESVWLFLSGFVLFFDVIQCDVMWCDMSRIYTEHITVNGNKLRLLVIHFDCFFFEQMQFQNGFSAFCEFDSVRRKNKQSRCLIVLRILMCSLK